MTQPSSMLVLAQSVVLVSWYKPLLLVALFAGWAWVVSTIYDKDSARWYLPRRMWNGIHMAAGSASLLLVLVAPLTFLITGPVVALILAADLLAYFVLRNQDERVPASAKWSLNPSQLLAKSGGKKDKEVKKTTALVFKGPKGVLAAPNKDTPEFEVRIAAEAVFNKLIDQHGTQIDIAPVKEGAYGVSYIADGVRQPGDTVPGAKALAMIDIFKGAAGLDVADRRRRQQGDFTVGHSSDGGTKVRVTTLGSNAGVQLSMLVDPDSQYKRKLEDLGLVENQLDDLKGIVSGKGVVLLVAPPDHGRTNTLYAIIRAHDAYTSNVQTLEYETMAAIEGVRQNKYDATEEKGEFSTTVRSMLRRDPDVVAVAEMPDENTGKEISRADHSRSRVYLSFNGEGALQGIQKYARAVGDQSVAAQGLSGAVGQRLVRRLCTNCRVAFQPTAEMLKKLGLPADTKQIHRKGGQVLIKDKAQTCPVCNGSGFFGQIGIFEVFSFGDEERKLIAAGDFTGLRGMLRAKKQQSMQVAGLKHVLEGHTSVEEVLRVTAAPAEQPPTPKPPAPSAPAAAPAKPAAKPR